MSNATAQLNNYRHSPRKVRLVADLIRGKSVENAEKALMFVDKKAALPLLKLLKSALANAKNLNIDETTLVVKEISVNGGAILYRRLPMARGRAFPMRKRTSHIKLVLAEKAVKNAPKAAPVSENKTKKPAKAKK